MTTPPTIPPPNPNVIEPPSFGSYSEVPGQLTGVDFWPRAGARVIDMIVHFVVSLCAGFVFGIGVVVVAGMMGRAPDQWLESMGHLGWASFALALLGSIAYHAVCEAVHGSTLGKLALSLVVVREDGSPCGFDSALLRSFAYIADSFFFGLVGYSAMQRSTKRQRFGDEWAHTVVCKRVQIHPQNLRGGGRFALAFVLGMAADALLLMAGWAIVIAR
jgi:uncharacterized RDD family membrane protein YckC